MKDDDDRREEEGLGPEDPTLQSPIPPPSEPVELGVEATASVAQWSREATDLGDEPLLRHCETVDFEGNPRPRLGRIALLSKLGQGGMGVVYHGVHTRLDTEVAVKLLPPILSSRQQDLLDRFEREAKIAARLHSDHLVGVHDIDTDEATGCHFIVMDYVHGVSGDGWLRRFEGVDPGVPESAALELCIAAARGLAVAHLEGVVHRDLKPANILIPEDAQGNPLLDMAKLADLGLARAEVSDEGVTGSSVAMGTPGYMAPEQAMDAKTVKKPADVFGLGATLYALLAGKAPFAGSSAAEAIVKTATGNYLPIEELRPDVSAPTRNVITTCLALDPADRFPDASALLEALEVAWGALEAVEGWEEAATRVAGIAEREEQGKRVLSDPSVDKAARARPTDPAWREAETVQMRDPATAQAVSTPSAAGIDVSARNRRSLLIGLLLVIPTVLATWAIVGGGGEPAKLYVTTKPPGVRVHVDGSQKGISPCLVPGLAEGGHEVRVTSPFHETQSSIVATELGATTTVHYEMVRGKARLGLTGGVPGATVTLTLEGADEPAHTLEADADGSLESIEVAAGKYQVVARREGHADFETRLPVERGADAALELVLPALTGVVAITSEPSGAKVLEDGRVLGTTPLEHEFTAGEHRVILRLAGHEPAELPVAATPDEAAAFGPVRLAAWGTLSFGELAEDVTVQHEGRVLRDGAALPPGGVRLEILRPGHAPQEHAVEVPLGGNARLTLRPWSEFVATIDLRGVPDDVSVRVDGRPSRGVLTFPESGTHSVSFTKPGRAPQAIEVDVALGATRRVEPGTWELLLGALDASGLPEGVTWSFADGEERDPSRLTPGVYRLRLERDGKLPQEIDVVVFAERRATVTPGRWKDDPGAWETALALLTDLAAWDAAPPETRLAAARQAAARLPGFAFRRLSTFEGGSATHSVAVFKHAATGLEFVLVPGGTFTMGSPEGERGRKDDEIQREVTLDAPFLVARTEVTQRAWEAVMDGNPSRYEGKDRPVENVSWEDATAFCEKAGLALPTEAQWEYACRAGTSQRYSGFDREKDLELYAWTRDNAQRKGTSPVGAKRPNAFGLLDVHGNVWEWCADADRDHTDRRVYRGGSWRNSARSARCAHRFRGAPDTRDAVLGFRPVHVLSR